MLGERAIGRVAEGEGVLAAEFFYHTRLHHVRVEDAQPGRGEID
ncbi:hypothetical protein [Trueperella pyogenes]